MTDNNLQFRMSVKHAVRHHPQQVQADTLGKAQRRSDEPFPRRSQLVVYRHEPYERGPTGRTCIVGDASEAAPGRERRVEEQDCLVPGRAVSSMPEVVVRM